jgi:predicted nucleic acid-binding protein
MTFSRGQRAIVLDASAAIYFLHGLEPWVGLWTEWANEGAMLLAPAHFPAEISNALLRSARLPVAAARQEISRLWASGVETTDQQLTGLIEAIELADQHRLSVYDALYLQLALDIGAEIATGDIALENAAIAEGLTVVSH